MSGIDSLLVERVMERLLVESGAPAVDPDYAVYVTPRTIGGPGGRGGVIYRSEVLTVIYGESSYIKDRFMLADVLQDAIIGYIEVGPPQWPCQGAWEVRYAAGPGFGKLVYGIGYALSPNNRLVPDRKVVSNDAYKAWSKVAAGGKGMPLDNFADPQTSDKGDDCRLHQRTDDDCAKAGGRDPSPINAAYDGGSWTRSVLASLKEKHAATMKQIEDLGGSPESAGLVEEALREAGERFFWDNYVEMDE